MIHVCFCFTDKTGRYSKFVGMSMLSIFENIAAPPPSVTIHILHDKTLTDDNRDKFSYVARHYGQIVNFYNVEELCAEDFANMTKDNPKLLTDTRFTIGMMFRIFIPQILSADIEKAIYLDADIIVNMDLNELYQIDLGDKCLAVVPSNSIAMKKHTHITRHLCVAGLVEPDDYFNSGVLLMNLKLLRNEHRTMMDGINFIGADPRYTHFDQDVLNYCFTKRILKLPIRFNNSVSFARAKKEKTIGQKIYHYLGSNHRSFGLNMSDPFNRLWISFFIKTPWFNADSIGRLYSSFQELRRGLLNSALKVSAATPGKKRAFFIDPQKEDLMKKIFSIQNDEEIILAENEDSLKKLIDAMKTSKDTCTFILTELFLKKKFPVELLQKEGFTEGKDFIRGWELLSEEKGVPFNSYPLVQSL
ncbi:MAG: glycosyltransferase family 8 protein [Selenomonadaceae bacterium]|nr:glycosyltransferase family 8 protein [Selenomonadaceae bacterium]